ncbi:MAG: DUF2812 domain-containing protein [Lachnospiraceae bacterium]|nr:DUF2812 domain-containing protein [Lachnospiraceae bacterium]
MRKTEVHIFTIADYEEEEAFLREKHRSGWKLVDMTPPCFYVFEECEPEDVIYRLDFKNNEQSPEYMQMAADFGWEYFAKCMGWLYFRKPADPAAPEEDGELFSDGASKAEMACRIVRQRVLPLTIIFLCIVVPNLLRAIDGKMSAFWLWFYGIMFVLYVFLIVYSSFKLKRIRDRYPRN